MKLNLPVVLASFVLSMLALVTPTPASAQQPTCGLDVEHRLQYPNNCDCDFALSYLVIKKPNCGGCCIRGSAGMDCPNASVDFFVNLCAGCGQSASQEFNCPGTSDPAWEVFITCKSC